MTSKYGSVYMETGEQYLAAICLLEMLGWDTLEYTKEESILCDILSASVKEYEVGLTDDEKHDIIRL